MKKIIKYLTLILLSFYIFVSLIDVFVDLGVNYYQNKSVWILCVLLFSIFIINKYAKQNKIGSVYRISFLASFLLWTLLYIIERTGNGSIITSTLMSICGWGFMLSFPIGIVAILKK